MLNLHGVGLPGYASDAEALTMAAHVMAVEFATIAAANDYWRKQS